VERGLTARYVDFTHDAHFSLLLPTLNLTSFAEAGPLPSDHIPKHRTFVSSEIMPFATNMQVQVLNCGVRGKAEYEDEDDKQKEEEAEEQEQEAKEENEAERGTRGTGVTGKRSSRRDVGDGRKVRIVLNDGVVPLTGIRGCVEDEEGLCDLGAFVESLSELMAAGDPDGVCR
jgi:hypothetical protein